MSAFGGMPIALAAPVAPALPVARLLIAADKLLGLGFSCLLRPRSQSADVVLHAPHCILLLWLPAFALLPARARPCERGRAVPSPARCALDRDHHSCSRVCTTHPTTHW